MKLNQGELLVIWAIVGIALMAVIPAGASAPQNVTVTISGPDEGWVGEDLTFTASGSYTLDGATQKEVEDGEATVSEEYEWSYAPAELVSGGDPSSSVTISYPSSAGGAYQTVSVTYTVTVTYKDNTSDSASASDSKQVKVKQIETAVSVGLDKESICAGGVPSPPHQASINVTVTDGFGEGVSGKAVEFSVTDSEPSYPASVSPTEATTDESGHAATTLTSSRKIGATATVKATCGDVEDETSPITMVKADAVWDIVPEVLIADGESTANVNLTLTFDGSPVDGHQIRWLIWRVWDGSDTQVYNADPQWGSKVGYGDIDGGPDWTDSNGVAVTVYSVGTEGGTIQFEALDDTVVEDSPGHYDGPSNKSLKPTKIDVKEIDVSGAQKIKDVGFTIYQAHYENGSVVKDIQHKPVAMAKAQTLGSAFELMTWPDGRDVSDVSWKYTEEVVKGQTVKGTATGSGTGMSGQISFLMPDSVGEYDLKHYFTLKQSGDWKGLLNELSDLYLTYATHQCSDEDFTVGHLERVCGWGQGTNDLTKQGGYSVPRTIQLACHNNITYQVRTENPPWPMIMGQLPGDCDDQAEAMAEALALLGISASTEIIEFTRICPVDGREQHYFYMKPTPTGPWNFHGVCHVENGYYYSVTQSNTPVGTHEEMWADGGLVVDSFDGWYTYDTGIPCTQ